MSDSKKLGIGIIGCGVISAIHAEAIKNSSNCNLISLFSRDINRAKILGEKYDAKFSNDWDEFIEDKRLNAVVICTASGTHYNYGKLAAEKGKHVIVEKPIEVSLKKAKMLISECEKNKVSLAVIYQSRFMDSVIKMKKSIDDGDLGKIFQGAAYVKWYRDQAYYDSAEWRGTFELDGGGVLINQAIHTIDILQWLMNGVKTVYGEVGTFTHKRIEGEDSAAAVLRFNNGAIGVIEASTSIHPAVPRKIEIHGEKGTATLVGDAFEIVTFDKPLTNSEIENEASNSGASSPLDGLSFTPHLKQFEAIADAIKNKKTPPISGKESIASLAIVKAIYESAKLNEVIKIDKFIDENFI
ncbi:MAG: Gfo/Idh/MocA family oxidoreductase [Melioribacteraceae bacterium]|nr:Gfo/Idh/MocA family oxidoreductase [Melioribacteraceae bacterium]